MWANAFAYVGGLATGYAGGTFALVGPSWQGKLPSGVKRIDCPTRWVERRLAAMRIVLIWLVASWISTSSAWGQPADDLYKGHELAVLYCGNCHLAAPDQPSPPVWKFPPAPSFESIAQRDDVSAQSLRTFLTTTHRGLDNPRGMPSPNLADYQINQVVTYILSMRKR